MKISTMIKDSVAINGRKVLSAAHKIAESVTIENGMQKFVFKDKSVLFVSL